MLKLSHYYYSIDFKVADAITSVKGKSIGYGTWTNRHQTPNLGIFPSAPTMVGVPKVLQGIFAMPKQRYNIMLNFIGAKLKDLVHTGYHLC